MNGLVRSWSVLCAATAGFTCRDGSSRDLAPITFLLQSVLVKRKASVSLMTCTTLSQQLPGTSSCVPRQPAWACHLLSHQAHSEDALLS